MIRAVTALAFLASCGGPSEGGAAFPEPVLRPGAKPMARLTRVEYDNTVQALFLTDARPAAETWPADPASYGFDNVADGLSVSPLHVELHEAAVDELLDDLLDFKDERTWTYRVQAEGVGNLVTGGTVVNAGVRLDDGGVFATTQAIDHGGRFELQMRAWTQEATVAPVEVRVDGRLVGEGTVESTADAPKILTLEFDLGAGRKTIDVTLATEEGAGAALMIDWIELTGPLDPEEGYSAGYAARVPCDPTGDEEACARATITSFGRLAWRRPLAEADVDDFMELYYSARELELDWHDGVKLALKGVLMSPEFLFKIEADSGTSGAQFVDAFELASRLSYFLWRGPPDETLLGLAEDGTLLNAAVLDAQVRRMMADDRAVAFIDGFAEQWLAIRQIDQIAPSPTAYPSFDEELREAMKEELRRLAADHLLEDRSVLELLTTKSTWMNARLAAHYGASWEHGPDEWALVDISGLPRAGVLTTPGWLAVHSDLERSSVVHRGKWIMTNLLCDEIPPPPPDVVGSADPDPTKVMSAREQLETTRTFDPACTGCHSWMDPLGFSLEHYDGVGAFRSVDVLGFPIDATGTLPDGTSFRTGVHLGTVLAHHPKVASCAAEKLFTYALGRPPGPTDLPYLMEITETFSASDHRFGALVEALVRSPVFKTRSTPSEVE